MTTPVRLLLILVAGAVAVAGVGAFAENRRPPEGVLLTEDGITVAVTEEARAAGVQFGGGFPVADREWVLAALAQARPEAAALLAEIDGLVTVSALPPELEAHALGRAMGTPRGFSVELALGAF